MSNPRSNTVVAHQLHSAKRFDSTDHYPHLMSDFLHDDAVDLTETQWTPDDLGFARAFYRQLFDELGETDWQNNPQGPLGLQWKSTGKQATSYVIHVARVLNTLRNGGITKKSVTVFIDKTRFLLRPTSDAAFAEALIELEVAFSIAQSITPISFEPLVPEHLAFAPSKPQSPDYAVLLPEGPLTIEVTVWHWDSLRKWDRFANEVTHRIGNKLMKSDNHYHVAYQLPLNISNGDLAVVTSDSVVQKILTSETGRLTIPISRGSAQVVWNELPHFESMESADWDKISRLGGNATIGPGVGAASSSAVRPIFDDEWADTALKSLRKSLDRKSGQIHPESPHILALGLGGHRLHWDWVSPLVTERIWPNRKYSWISALGAYTPEQGWETPTNDAGLRLFWNPNAEHPVPPSLRAVAEEGAQFHRQ